MKVALKVDVDTHQGLAEGVPRLMRVLAAEGVSASFFVAMGPDNSGRAIVRVFRNPGFLSKMRRTNAVSMYGWRTVLSGTVLPARPIALAHPEVIRSLAGEGFEVGVHGYDHVLWQDNLDSLGGAIVNEIDEAFEVFRAIVGESARSFAAPGWRTNEVAMRSLDGRGLLYRSDTRGRAPYRCGVNGMVFNTIEIPTTLPTMDELMGTADAPLEDSMMRVYLDRFGESGLNVHTIHAETEGMAQLDAFASLIRELKRRGAQFVQLRDIAAGLNGAELPICEVVRTTLPGRAGWISAQGAEQRLFEAPSAL